MFKGLENWPRRRKATVKIRKNTAPGFIRLDPKLWYGYITPTNEKKSIILGR